MNNKTMILAAGLLVLASIAPVAAYHIQGNYAPAGDLTSGDWVLDNSALIICESDGLSDPRLSRDVANPGIGGLCTTGRNNATNFDVPAADFAAVPTGSSVPVKGDWTKLDICSEIVDVRSNTPSVCLTDTIGFTAEIGAYSCFVRGGNAVFPLSVPPTGLTTDRALYYEELYAWWSYDGNATAGEIGPGFHGHVAAYPGPINRGVSTSFQPVMGSAITFAVTGPGANEVSCGGSPSTANSQAGDNGPVVMADP